LATGDLALVLHAHLPYVHSSEPGSLEEDWYFQALLECYLPLLEVLRIKGVKVVLMSTDGMVPRELRNAADRFVDLNDLRPALEKADGQAQP